MAAVEPRRANLAPRAALLCRPHSNALLGLGLNTRFNDCRAPIRGDVSVDRRAAVVVGSRVSKGYGCAKQVILIFS